MALKSLRDVNGRIVAFVSITVIGAAVAFAFAVGQLHLLDGGYEMSGVFADTGGVKPGQDVRVAGVKAGRVTSVKPDFRQGNVVITWTVKPGIELGRNTRAEVATATLLGGRYLKLSGAVGSKPYMADLPARQRRIPITRTSVPFTVTDAIEGATNITRKLDKNAVSKLLDEAAKIKTPSSERLQVMLRNFQTLSATLNDQYPDIAALIANSKKITGTLAAKDQQLSRIITSSRTLLQTLVNRRAELAATIGQGDRTVRTLDDVISKHQTELNILLKDLHLLTTRLQPNMEALNTDFALLGPTFIQVANVKGNGNWVEGLLTGLGPIQPNGPISTPRKP